MAVVSDEAADGCGDAKQVSPTECSHQACHQHPTCEQMRCTVCVMVVRAQSVDEESDNELEANVKLLQSTDTCLFCLHACLPHNCNKCYLLIDGRT